MEKTSSSSIDYACFGFDLDRYLLSLDESKLYTPGGRRELTREDPLAFALLYLPHHLQGAVADEVERVTLSEFHFQWAEYGKKWMTPAGRRESRTCFVAPRNMGKSTWLFTILPLWAAAHGWIKFAAAFSDASDQSKAHLETFRNELYANELLRLDFPAFVDPKRRPVDPDHPQAERLIGRRVNESQEKIHQANDFVFWAKGMSGASLGMKVGARRPDLIILDDIEPSEDKYSSSEIRKRLVSLTDKILYLNEAAHVVLVGTVTKIGSIVHQLIQHELAPKDDDPAWIVEQNFKTHYFAPILSNANGSERSCWPEKWPLERLQAIRRQRDYKKNFENQPVNVSGDYWELEDIRYVRVYTDSHRSSGGWVSSIGPGSNLLAVTRKILTIDPAVTSRSTSDYTGIAAIGCNPFEKICVVESAWQVKIAPKALREFVVRELEEDEDIAGVIIEVNQGGDTWKDIMHDLPVKLLTVTSGESKILRFTRLLTHYQRSRVFHRLGVEGWGNLAALEEQMLSYDGSPFATDDLLDAVSIGVDYFLSRLLTKKVDRRAKIKVASYA